jgi:predicted RND superfamily exporter protein
MEKWYVRKALLTALVLTTLLGFLAYLFHSAPQIKRLGLVIFLTGGALVLVRGIIKITMGMRQ